MFVFKAICSIFTSLRAFFLFVIVGKLGQLERLSTLSFNDLALRLLEPFVVSLAFSSFSIGCAPFDLPPSSRFPLPSLFFHLHSFYSTPSLFLHLLCFYVFTSRFMQYLFQYMTSTQICPPSSFTN